MAEWVVQRFKSMREICVWGRPVYERDLSMIVFGRRHTNKRRSSMDWQLRRGTSRGWKITRWRLIHMNANRIPQYRNTANFISLHLYQRYIIFEINLKMTTSWQWNTCGIQSIQSVRRCYDYVYTVEPNFDSDRGVSVCFKIIKN